MHQKYGTIGKLFLLVFHVHQSSARLQMTKGLESGPSPNSTIPRVKGQTLPILFDSIMVGHMLLLSDT